MIINPVAQQMLPKRIKLEQMRRMSDDDLLKFLSGEDGIQGMVYPDMQQTILAELHRRNIESAKKPHKPTFILVAISAFLAMISVPQVQLFLTQKPQPSTPSPSYSINSPSSPAASATAPTSAPMPTR